MPKKIPIEQLIGLHNKLLSFSPRSQSRSETVKEFSEVFGVSISTVYRQLREQISIGKESRIDKNRPRVLTQENMLMYCRIIAALKVRTSNKKNRHLSTSGCIRLLEDHGVETEKGFIKASPGLLKKTTVNRYLKNWGYDDLSMQVQPAVVRFEAEQSNDCWQFDFTPSDLKWISTKKQKLYIASVTDDKSGLLYFEYVEADGEDALTALQFLFHAMAPKKEKGMLFQGIPKMIYTDNGSFAKSSLFKRTLSLLNIELKSHLPRGHDGRRVTARSKGKIERTNRTIKESFETLFHLHHPKNVGEANTWAKNYLSHYNQLPHRSEKCSRTDSWKKNLPQEGFKQMCSWDKFCYLVRDPERRQVGSDGCVQIEGTLYQLSPDMAGLEVTLLHGIFDHELYVEQNGERHGPFYPSQGPIPLHSFRKPQKSKAEKRADDIGELAKSLSVPLSVMTGEKERESFKHADLFEQKVASIPFDEDKKRVFFPNKLEAKQFISQFLNRPLADLTEDQKKAIDQIVSDSLEKDLLLSKVRAYFSLSLCNLKEN